MWRLAKALGCGLLVSSGMAAGLVYSTWFQSGVPVCPVTVYPDHLSFWLMVSNGLFLRYGTPRARQLRWFCNGSHDNYLGRVKFHPISRSVKIVPIISRSHQILHKIFPHISYGISIYLQILPAQHSPTSARQRISGVNCLS